jgi:hypothetical protein
MDSQNTMLTAESATIFVVTKLHFFATIAASQ